jgi:hypothetical protein
MHAASYVLVNLNHNSAASVARAVYNGRDERELHTFQGFPS